MRTAEPSLCATEVKTYAELSARAKANVSGGVFWARLEIADQVDLSARTFDAAEYLVVGESRSGFVPVRADGHAIGQHTFPCGGGESSVQNIGALEITA